MSKKVIGALLAIFMVLSVFSFTVFAVSTGYEAEGSTNKQTWGLANKQQGSNGTYTVDVILSTNYKVGPIQFKITGVDSITKVDVNETAYYAAEENHSSSGLVILTPNTSADLLGKELSNAVVATVTYTSSSNGTPAIEDNPKSAFNPQGSLMAARLEGSDYVNKVTSLVVGQTTKVYDLDEEWDEEEPPATEVTLTGVNGGVVDATNGYVYGVPAGTTDVTTYFTTTGYIEMVASELDKTNGTGAQLKLYDAQGGTLKATYTLIIFGDVNGDGAIDVNDSVAVGKHVSSTLSITSQVYLFAADVNEPGATPDVNVNDLNALNKHVSSTLLLSSNVRAA